MWRGAWFFGCLAVACASSQPRAAGEQKSVASEPIAPAPSSTPPTPATAVPDAGAPAESNPAVPTLDLLAWKRVLENPVHSLALGEPPRVAALGDETWLDAGKGLARVAQPPRPTINVDVFFGRDNAPRLLGFERSSKEIESIYFRWRGGAWQRAASEIGKLGSATPGALFGVIGDADPEVVCKTGESCIVKRRSGWTTITAPPGTPRILLCGKTPWAFEQSRVFRLEKTGFRAFGEPASFARADGLWAPAEDEVWVAERETNALYRFREKWSRESSPVAGPRALWATDPANVWLVGDGGVAHYDGHAWSRVRGPTGALEIVTGRSANDVWVAGASGIWHGSA